MTTPKNAARVAVEAAALPTAKQVQFLACQMMNVSIMNALCFVSAAGQWDDSFRDSIHVAELAQKSVRELASNLPDDADDFLTEFFRAESAAKLARDAFPLKDSPAWRSLNSAVTGFADMFHALEMVGAFEEEGGAQ